MNKQWNVVSTLFVLLVLIYTGSAVWCLYDSKLAEFKGFHEFIMPLILLIGGYLARMLGEPK